MKVYKFICLILITFVLFGFSSCACSSGVPGENGGSITDNGYIVDDLANFYKSSVYNNVQIVRSYDNELSTYKFQDNKFYYKAERNGRIYDEYYCEKISDNNYIIYYENDGIWKQTTKSNYPVEFNIINNLFSNLKYDLYIFDCGSNSYKYIKWLHSSNYGSHYDYEILKFNNDKLMEYIRKPYSGYFTTYTFSMYGEVSIEFPM